ncbi:MAG: flavodoxin domain-containing protein [Candidatus Bathyarchaeia archaeon]|jgi:menaquinone-dependent protoporphyrinogen oxidase
MKTLLAYGTRYGATAGTSQEIAKILSEQGFDVKVANLKEEKIKDITPYELVIVGTGVQMDKWTGEAEDFLKKHEKELAQKKLALFVSTMKTVSEREGKTADLESARKFDLDNKLPKYSFQPISVGFFGGVINYNKMNFFFRKTLGSVRSQLEKDGFEQTEPGVYELRDWDEIRAWTKDLVQKARTN